jgi:hypothetical protein
MSALDSRWGRARLAALQLVVLTAAATGAASCIKRGYPLGRSGNVEIRTDVAGVLFATDTLDGNGKPLGPRQSPNSTGVTLAMTEGSQAAFGAFVEVRVEPSEALSLISATGETTDNGLPTCAFTEGSFRCMATGQGTTRFTLASESDWSGDAKLIVSWADQTKEQVIHVNPAGLPSTATNFSMIVGGIDDVDHVLATFLPLQCTIGPLPDDLGSKWRKGQIRSRETYVRATPPSAAPSVVENAPVIVESLGSEAALSLAEGCEKRETRLRVRLDSTGQSSPFYICFSDIGGTIPFSVTSGEKAIEPNRSIVVDAEPRLLRVRTLTSQVTVGFPVDLFEISAYNANRVRIAMPVDLHIGDDQVLNVDAASLTLADEANVATVIQAGALKPGVTELHVSPRLLAMPDCVSPAVTVVAPLP